MAVVAYPSGELGASAALPQNLEAERSVLGAVLLDPIALRPAASVLEEDDFFPGGHSLIYRTMLELSRRGTRIDLLMLKEELANSGILERVGGASYLSSLLDAVPDVGYVEYYARIVKEKSAQRRLIEAGQRLVREGLSQDKTSKALLDQITAEVLAVARSSVSKSALLSPGRVLRESPLRNAVRIKTELPTLDDATRGGPPVGSVVVMQGPPGAGKSTLAIQMARAANEQGAFVMMLCVDEGGSEPASVKLGQHLGLKSEDLEAGDEAAAQALDEWADGRFVFLPPDTGLREAVAVLHAVDTQRPKVLVIDTLQSVDFEADDQGHGKGGQRDKSERLRLTAGMKFIRDGARTLPALFIVLSEVARGAYASADSSAWTSDLAAGAETRAIEFKADLLMFVREKSDGISTLRVAKNRPGRGHKPCLSLQHNRISAMFTEAPPGSEERSEVKDRRRLEASGEAQKKILAAMKDQLPRELAGGRRGLSETKLALAAGLSRGREPFHDALSGLRAQGLLESLPGPRDGTYWRFKDGKVPADV